MIKRLQILSVVVLALLCLVMPQTARAAQSTLNVTVDHGTPMSLSAPAASVFIANPDIADMQVMSPTSVMVFGKRTGSTTFMATDRNGHVLAHYTVLVTQDLSDLRVELDAAIPGNHIKAQALPNGLVLTGEARDPAAVADAYRLAQRYIAAGGDVINRIKVLGSNQIQIRVRFAEVSRSVNTTLGIDWGSAANYGGFAFALGTGAGVARDATGALIRPNNSSLTTANDVLGITHIGNRTNINAVIDALAQDGLVNILAEPNLTAMSGETASFLAGGEFPIPVPQSSSGSGTVITVDFKNYGISLSFTPTLIGENRINLHVKPEVSQLTTNGAIVLDNITVPALTTRKAETTVEVASGESFAIAGLIDNDQAQTINKFPLIGDMPIIGALFRSNQFQNNQSELVIIITPYIVRPTDGQQLALPNDGYAPPTDIDRLVKLRYSASDPDSRTMSGAPLAVKDTPVPPQPSPVVAVETVTETTTTTVAPAGVAPVPNDNDAAGDTDAVMEPAPAPPPVSSPLALPPRQTKTNANGFIME